MNNQKNGTKLSMGHKQTLADYDRQIESANQGGNTWKYWDLKMRRQDFLRQVKEGLI